MMEIKEEEITDLKEVIEEALKGVVLGTIEEEINFVRP